MSPRTSRHARLALKTRTRSITTKPNAQPAQVQLIYARTRLLYSKTVTGGQVDRQMRFSSVTQISTVAWSFLAIAKIKLAKKVQHEFRFI